MPKVNNYYQSYCKSKQYKKSKYHKNPVSNEAGRLIIQDNIVVSPPTKDGKFSKGQFENQEVEEPRTISSYVYSLFWSIKTPLDRLVDHIQDIIMPIAARHKELGNKNTISRIITNEFLFYTKAPLSISEFEYVQQKVFNLAKELPDNL